MTVMIQVVQAHVEGQMSKDGKRYLRERSFVATHIDLGDGPLCGFHREGMVLLDAFDVTCDKCRAAFRKKVKVPA